MDCKYCETQLTGPMTDLEPDPVVETSNPGVVGVDTGHTFKDPKTRQTVRVIARVGEDRDDAIKRVRERHNMGG